jgi:hypothetical protein
VVAALALLALPAGAALAATEVGNATLQVSSLSASATDASYTVNFATPSAMTSGTSTITITAPAGTVLPAPSGTCYKVYDDPGGAAFGTSGCGTVTLTGTTAVITVPLNIAAGDPVSVIVPGVTNPASTGSKTLTVSTNAATKAASLHFTLVAKRAVTHAALHVSSASASATGVTYSVTFTSPDRLASGSQVTVKFPTGTVMSPGGCSVVTWIDDTNGSGTSCADYSATGTTATITFINLPPPNPGDTITVTFGGMGNATAKGSHNVTLSTTSDPKAVTLSYSLVAKRAVTNKFLQLSSYTARASNVTWSVGFTAPDRLIDTGNGVSSSTVIIKAPAGTVFPSGSCAYTFIDTAQAGGNGPEDCPNATVTGTTVSITGGFDTNPGNTLFIVINGVKNPSAMSAISVSTSADPKTVSLPLTGPTAMSATDQLSSTSASATQVAYTETFASTGALTSGTSTLTLTSAGATFPLCSFSGEYIVVDDTTGAEKAPCPVNGSSPGPSITLADNGLTTSAGDEITVLAQGVSNAATSGGKTFSVTTSSAGGASLPAALTAETAVSPPIFSIVSTSASASGVAFSATFTEANGFTPSGAGENFSTIGVTLASGTKLPASGFADVFNDSTGQGGGTTFTASGATAAVQPGTGGNTSGGPGDEITVVVFGAQNPASAGAATAAISTTSDPAAASAGYTLTARKSVSKDILQLSSVTGGASNVTYTLTFRTTNGLVSATNPGSTITVTLPAGTVMPPNGSADVSVVDSTTGQSCGGNLTSSGTTGTIAVGSGSCEQETGAGDVITLVLTGETNAHSLSGAKVQLATSSDPAPVTTAVP